MVVGIKPNICCSDVSHMVDEIKCSASPSAPAATKEQWPRCGFPALDVSARGIGLEFHYSPKPARRMAKAWLASPRCVILGYRI